MTVRARCLFAAIACGFALTLAAASPSAKGSVSILDDGTNGRPARLLFHGPIRRGDAAAFAVAIQRIDMRTGQRINDVPFVTVELDSPGGDLVEALEIGRTIYQHFMMTLVRPGHECVSACVFLLVAGAVHTPADGAAIGLHRPLLVSWTGMTFAQAHAKYDALMLYLKDYFRTLGVGPDAYRIMMGTDSFGMRYFGSGELDSLGLRGEDPAWEKLYGLRWAAQQTTTTAKGYTRGELPKLAAVDTSVRDLVFMPGAYHFGTDYFAGVHVPRINFTWQAIDSDEMAPASGASLPPLMPILRAIADALRPFWLPIAISAFEILRHRRRFG